MVSLVSTGEAVRPCARPKDTYFRTADPKLRSGIRLTLILFIYQRRIYPCSLPNAATRFQSGRVHGATWPPNAFWDHKPTEITSKDAPQRRVYARSLQKGPIDGTH
eukprot:gene16853-biopygen18827